MQPPHSCLSILLVQSLPGDTKDVGRRGEDSIVNRAACMRPVLWRKRCWVAEPRKESSWDLSQALLTQEVRKGGPEGPCHPARMLAPSNRRQDTQRGQPGWRWLSPHFSQEEYIREQMDWREIAFADNQPCINLISLKPYGILRILDDQCCFPQVSPRCFCSLSPSLVDFLPESITLHSGLEQEMWH